MTPRETRDKYNTYRTTAKSTVMETDQFPAPVSVSDIILLEIIVQLDDIRQRLIRIEAELPPGIQPPTNPH